MTHRDPKPGVGIGRQFATCAAMCALALAVMLLHPQALPAQLLSGLPVSQQVIVGLAIGGAYFLCSAIGLKYSRNWDSTKSTAESYSRLDLNGWNPLWIALAAGFGEELLFRGALQPIIGIWFTSALFVLAHTRAYRFNAVSRRVLIQAAGIFTVSVFLGYVAHYAGLVTAMIIHAAVDVVGLYAVRRMARYTVTSQT